MSFLLSPLGRWAAIGVLALSLLGVGAAYFYRSGKQSVVNEQIKTEAKTNADIAKKLSERSGDTADDSRRRLCERYGGCPQ